MYRQIVNKNRIETEKAIKELDKIFNFAKIRTVNPPLCRLRTVQGFLL